MSNTQTIQTQAAADRPTFTILADGEPISAEVQVMSVAVEREANRVASATLIIHDGDPSSQDFPNSNSDVFLPGKPIEIQAGYHSEEDTVFKGIVVKQLVRTFEKKSSVLEVLCKDEAVKMTIGRKNYYYYESTDSDILEEIIERIGLTPDVETTNTTHPEMVQFNATDWDFIVSRAESNGKLVYTENGTIRVATPDLGLAPKLSLAYGGNVLDFEAEMDARYQYSGVHAYAWDAANQEFLDLEGEPPAGDLPGNVSPDDLSAVIGLETYDLRHGGLVKDTDLQAQADALVLKSRLAKIRGRVRVQGIADILPGQMVDLTGVGDRFTGPVFVSGLMHEINTKNWETQIQLGLSPHWFIAEADEVSACPASHMLPAVNGLQIGLVTANESDPEGEDRVRVRTPLIDPSEEGVWARVACLDAGENRGTFFRPEIGDEVVLGFLDEDPRNPVILGMLNSSAKPAPIAGSDDNHEKGIVTRSEMKLIFDDDKVSLTIETPNGNKMVISDEQGGISLEDENGNKLVMDSSGITIESSGDINIKSSGDTKIEGTNIQQSASANFKAEGSGGAELSTSATAVVKGSMVQIN